SPSFEDAITQTKTLLTQVSQTQINDEGFAKQVQELVQTANGARGFFVIYLTTTGDFADRPSRELLQALDTSPEIVSELLVKNLAMSSATAVLHRRNQTQDLALGSDKVLQRTLNLINQTNSPAIAPKLTALKTTILTGTGEYQAFIERWDYDGEQKQAILTAIAAVNKK
ncbi:MAG: hypothetical protein ACRC6M_10235, partial [Microcystaceae cyanobacterium]